VTRLNSNMAKHNRRSGFSLAEILIALAIIATLAAVLIPTVAGQLGKSDATRAIQDVTAIRSGIEQFLSDVHRYPGRVSHLTNQITVAQRDVNTNLYTAGVVSKWKGPYLGRDTVPGSGGYQTGFGGVVHDSLQTATFQAGVNYVTVVITGIPLAEFNRIDGEIDGTVSATTGLLRWVTGGGSGIDTVRFLAMPIQ
jgi:prepilin-type N-terminal cleavage/methylation domain-containing protein